MKKIPQWFKKTALFIFGIILIIWGYQVNASNSDKKKRGNDSDASQSLKTDSIKIIESKKKAVIETESVSNKLDKQPEKTVVPQTKKKPAVTKPKKTEAEEVKKAKVETVIESDTKAEESSATQ